MNFEKADLLNFDEVENLLTIDTPNERADIICKKIIKYCFFLNGVLYKYDNKLVIYKRIDGKDETDQLITMLTGFISASRNNLNKEQVKLLKLEHKNFKTLCENSTMNKMIPQLSVGLKVEEERFFGDFYEVHYKNGYIDMKTLEFKQRIPNKHFVCNYIKRDYKKSTQIDREEIKKRLYKIYPKLEDLIAILFILGSGLTGKATKEQKILFLLGIGGNGKSVIMDLTMKAIEGYMDTLEEEAFSVSNKNADKTFSTFRNRPHIRIIWTNEPKADQMNATTFKKFTEGEMKGKLLYQDGVHDFNHNALPVFTANIMPNIKTDGGVVRRFRGYNHTSLFVTDKNKVDESKHIYFVDRDFVDKIRNDGLLDAWVDLLCEYGNKWYNGEEIPTPESFKQATEEMMEVNDHIQDFVDAKLKFTTTGDKIGKNEMIKLYQELYPKKNISVQQIISLLKPKVKWNKELRCPITGIKGCFYDVVEKNDNDILKDAEPINDNETKNIKETKISPLDYGLDYVEIKEDNELQQALARIKELEAIIENMKPKTDNKIEKPEAKKERELNPNNIDNIDKIFMKAVKEKEEKENDKVKKVKKNKSTKPKVEEIDEEYLSLEKDLDDFF